MKLVELSNLIFRNGFIRHAIVKNAFWLTISMGISTLVSFLVVIGIARHYGPSVYGQWAFALAFVNFFSVLVEFGFEILMIREVSRDKSKTSEYIDNIIAMKAFFSLVAIALIFIVINFLRSDPVVLNLVYSLGIYMVINSFSSLFQTIFRANEKMYYETICYLLQGVLMAGLVYFFIFKNSPISYIAYTYIGVASVASIFSLSLIWRYFSKFFFKISFIVIKRIFFEVWAYALSSIVLSFYVIDTVLLGVMKSNAEVGWYSAAYRVPLFVQVLGLIIWRGFFPQLSQRYRQGPDYFKLIIEKLARAMHFFAWPLAFGGVILSGRIIVLLFGQSYLPGKLAFEILICAMSLSFVASIFNEPVKASDNSKAYLLGVSVGALINIISNLLLIPRFGINGAAAAYLMTQIGFTLFMYYQLNKIVKVKIYKYMGIPLISSVVMSLFIYFISNRLNVLIVVALGATVYTAMYFLISLFFVKISDKLMRI